MRPRLRRIVRYNRPVLIVTAVIAVIFLVIAFPLWPYWQSHREHVGFAEFLLSCVAVWFARDTVVSLVGITESVSTRFVGPFPEHLSEIRRLVADARSSIEILTDCVDYGSLHPRLHAALMDELESACGKPRRSFLGRPLGSRRVSVSIAVWGKPRLISSANHLGAEGIRDTPEFARTVRDFCRQLPTYQKKFVDGFGRDEFAELVALADRDDVKWGKAGPSMTFDKVMELLQEWEISKLRNLEVKVFGHAFPPWGPNRPLPLTRQPPQAGFLFWLVDGDRAVLLVLSRNEDAMGFVTQDTNLVQALQRVFRDKSEEIERFHITGEVN